MSSPKPGKQRQKESLRKLEQEQKEAWKEEWKTLVGESHTDQAIWFLNGFWDDCEDDAEKVWEMVHLMIEIDVGKPKLYGTKKWEEKEGCDLNQFKAHQFLEKIGETLTVKELGEVLKKIDIDNNRRMCITEYLVYKYGKNGKDTVNSPQGGGDPEEFKKGKALFNQAKDALNEAIRQQQETDEACKRLEKEEKDYNDKIMKLETKVSDKRLSAAKLGKYKNELAQLKGEDPLPLRKAQLTSKACLKKNKKATKAAKKAFKEASDYFDKLKKQGGAAHGAIWWMERELEEIQKFSPTKKKRK